MMKSCLLPWSVVEDDMLIHSAGSLPELAAVTRGQSRSAMLDQLFSVNPFAGSFDHPMMQLYNCARAVQHIVAVQEFCLSNQQGAMVVSIYEAGLLVGYDGLAPPKPQTSSEKFTGTELTDVSRLAWRHGHAVRRHWITYEKLVSVLVRGAPSC